MNKENANIRLQDPLSEIARKSRRNLLAFAFLGLAVTKLGFIPTQIANLGISFTSSNQASVLLIILGAIIYFLITFWVYASSDLAAWLMKLKRASIEQIMTEKWVERKETIKNMVNGANNKSIMESLRGDLKAVEKKEFDAEMEKYVEEFLGRLWSWAWWFSAIRLFVDFVFPVLLSIYSLSLLSKQIIAF